MDDRARVEELLGRPPRGSFDVVVRDDSGDPVVLRNSPLLDDGTPMPTRFYLVGKDLVRDVSRLEAAGGVRAAERAIDPAAIAEVHERYAAEREAVIPTGHTGPRPAGGVGGTRTGVKCLHAHVAHELAGGDDPVGRWALEQLERTGSAERSVEPPHRDDGTHSTGLMVDVADRSLTFTMGSIGPHHVPIGPLSLTDLSAIPSGDCELPSPVALSNALGAVHDHLDDVLIAAPEMRSPSVVTARGAHVVSLARVEHGSDRLPADYRLSRSGADEVFRTVVGEMPAERVHNPGLDPSRVHTIIPTCCIVLGVMRGLELDQIRIDPTTGSSEDGTVS
jgi:hypothetical protein